MGARIDDDFVDTIHGRPTIEDLQERPALPAALPSPLPVAVEGPVQTQAVPTQVGIMAGRTLGDTSPVVLLPTDTRRAKATIISKDQDIYIGAEQTEVTLSPGGSIMGGAWWPKNTPLVITGSQRVWIAAAVAPTSVSVITEQWAL